MKNPFKKKAKEATNEATKPAVRYTIDEGMVWDVAMEVAKRKLNNDHSFVFHNSFVGALPTPPQEVTIYRLVPVAVVRRQEPIVTILPGHEP